VLEVGILFSAAKSLTAVCLCLIFVLIASFSLKTGALSLVLGDTLSLRLLVGCSGSGSLCLRFGGLAFLLTFYFGVLSSIPRFKYLYVFHGRLAADSKQPLALSVMPLPILTSLSSSSSPNWRRRTTVTGGVPGAESLPSLSSSSNPEYCQLNILKSLT
jgi:hypothetical protein